MNKIYKVIWSKTKQRYVVVSELAHSCAKQTERTLGKSAAALMAVLALTAGVGIVPVWAAEAVTPDEDGNIIIYGDEEATIHKETNNHDSNTTDSLLIGDGITVGHEGTGASSNFVGGSPNSTIIGNDITVIGRTNGASSVGNNVALGEGITIGGLINNSGTIFGASDSVAIGNKANIQGGYSVVIGQEASYNYNGKRAVAIGYKAKIDDWDPDEVDGANSAGQAVAIGAEAIASNDGVAIGDSAKASRTATVIGAHSTSVQDSVIVGRSSNLYSNYSIGIGSFNTIGEKSHYSTALGNNAKIGESDYWSTVIGARTTLKDNSRESVLAGYQGVIGANSGYSTAIGNSVSIAEKSQYAVALGYDNSISGNSGTAIGSRSAITANYGTAIGAHSSINTPAITANYGSTVGYNSFVKAVKGTALGASATVEEGADNSTSIGSGSTATKEDILSDEDVKAFIAGLDTNVLGSAYNDFYNIQNGDTNGVISVGTASSPRRIINVAKGRIGPDSTDAVNGSQLYGAMEFLGGRIDALEENMGGGEILPDDDNITIKHPEGETATGGNTDTGNTGEIGTGTGETGLTGDSGTDTSSETPANDNTHYVGLTEDVVLGEQNEDGTFNSGSLTVQKDANGNAITINKEDENGVGDGLVSGLNNTDWDWNKYEQGGYAESSNAATEAQLHGAMEGAVQYDRNEDGTVNKGDIYLDQGGTVIHNVAAGTADMDAVNVSQLNEAWDQINNNTTAITNIGNKVGELDSRIDEVGAGAAALAALHPLDFDPDDKWDFAAGYGNYRGENAVAIGAFYRPNEDTMFSVGGTVGNDDNMVNAGVSFKIGQGNGVSTSRVAMAKEIKDLRKELEAMKSAMLDVNAGRRLDTSKLQLFPDVPQNHWAYEYVATLAGNGVIEGYPDGNFDGARPMTRYEFAAMLYRAMLNGAKLSDKILAEFAPELERFTVDVVHKDKDGNPTVERVRVVKRDDTAK